MMRMVTGLFVACFAGVASLGAAEKDGKLYELRVYACSKGKQAEVVSLIGTSGMKNAAKHGIELLGAWVPVDSADERVYTLVGHKDKASAEKNWAAFRDDPVWKAELEAASKNGRAVTGITQYFLAATDYSPAVKPVSVGNRVFELRTYAASTNNLGHLNARFRNHTMKLFEKHGMTNIAYFNFSAGEKTTTAEMMKGLAAPGKDAVDAGGDGPAGAVGLVYFITHKSADAMKSSFDSFRKDDAWKAVVADSEKKAGGSLTAKNGVKSLLLKPTDYSPIK